MELSGGEADYDDGGGEVDASPSAGESGGPSRDGLTMAKTVRVPELWHRPELRRSRLGDDGATQDNDDDYTPNT